MSRGSTPVANPVLARIDDIVRHGTVSSEGRSAFEAFAEVVQPSHGPRLLNAAVAAAVLIASSKCTRKQACDHCELPEGGARSRVGALAKHIKEVCCAGYLYLPALPEEWATPPVPAAAPAKQLKHKRKVEVAGAQPEIAEFTAKHYKREQTSESSALSPQGTRRIHVLQYGTPEGGCELSAYPADATPFEEAKQARSRRLATNRERRRQAFKVRAARAVCEHLCDRAHRFAYAIAGVGGEGPDPIPARHRRQGAARCRDTQTTC